MMQTLECTPQQIQFSIPEATVRQLRINGTNTPIIGQDRAISALELGLGIRADGYNIFIMGASGTGRRTVLTTLLKNYRANPEDLQDIAYVCNFKHQLEPRALFFPPETGIYFRDTLKTAIESIRKQVVQISNSEVFATARKKITAEAESQENLLLSKFETEMALSGFSVIQIRDDEARSMDLVPIVRNKSVTLDELQRQVATGKLPQEKLNTIRENYFRCLDRMSDLFSILRERRKETEKKVRALRTESATPIIENELTVLTSLLGKKPANHGALEYLKELKEDLFSNKHLFDPFKSASHKRVFFGRYAVNLVCEHTKDKNYIVQEEVPTFVNLFGSIDPSNANDDSSVNGHLHIRPGAIHRAAGGFLILRLQDVLMEEGTWPYLKRVLQSGKAEIQTPPSGNHLPSILKPQALPINLKVIIIGGSYSYDFLYQEDPDFQKLFKVCAEFDSVMPLTDENMARVIAFVTDTAKRSGTLPIDDSGLARILTYAARVSEYRTMLTTRFILISDLILEADYHARKQTSPAISREIVAKAIEHRQYLQKLPEEKYSEMVKSREIVLDVTGAIIGKVNGLAIMDRGYHAFGIPIAVTAQAAPGNKGIINIERESGLSGEIYDKAHLIIQGLLHRKYAQDIPLALSASICFEQSYTEVDGDSASCAEFFALLSAIAQIPLRQDIAVTGSLNQLGDVQPVGGIPEKIEGFFETCSILGLTGTQGVIIPRRNMSNLLPSERLQTAVEDGLFHIWAIDTVDEGISLLAPVSSAEFDRKVREVLLEHAERMRKFAN
ncbi:MAG TPA: AAA family ATPase [Treponema sp.]|nr:AAA family ATPase [Treponema sp.]